MLWYVAHMYSAGGRSVYPLPNTAVQIKQNFQTNYKLLEILIKSFQPTFRVCLQIRLLNL